MRDYARISSRFWTGPTGKAIRALGAPAQVIACYLFSSPGSNMIGLYYLPLPTLCHETGVPSEGASKALRSLEALGFSFYDQDAEVVWVPEMAEHQIAPTLKPEDNRVKSVCKELATYSDSRFYVEFLKRYRVAFSLPDDLPAGSPFEAPSKPLRSQEQEQEQEAGTSTRERTLFEGVAPSPSAPVAPSPLKASRSKPEPLPEIPAELDVPEFREAWAMRLRERAQRPAKDRLTPEQAAAQLKKLAKVARDHGIAVAAGCVEKATEGGYKGVVFADALPAPNGANGRANGKAYHPAGRPNIVAGIDRSLLGAPEDLDEHERELQEMHDRQKANAARLRELTAERAARASA